MQISILTSSRTLDLRRRGAIALAVLFALGGTAQAAQPSASLTRKAVGATDGAALASIAQSKKHVRVIVMFESPVAPGVMKTDAEGVAQAIEKVAATRNPLLSTYFGSATNPRPAQGFQRGLTTFPVTPGFAIDVTPQELEALAADPRVIAIHQDRLAKPTLNETVPLIGMLGAYALGATGSGRTVAILDTGIKSTHEFLSGQVIAEACFSNANGGGGGLTLCPNGSTSQTGAGAANANTTNCNDAAKPPTDFNLCEHGTHVAGIAAGYNVSRTGSEPPNGVAKSSKIFAIQIFTRFNDAGSCGGTAPCVLSYDSDQIAGLNHVFVNRNIPGSPVASVNMSLGGGLTTTTCDSDPLKPSIDTLLGAGIPTAIAAGNDGETNQISFPGCISTAFTVGSTTKTDVVSSFSNMSSVVDVLGPGGEGGSCAFVGGAFIVGPVVTNAGSTTTYGCLVGTSMAAPHVAGAIATLRGIFPGATAAQIQAALINTGKSVSDTRVGPPAGSVTKPRIRVGNAAQQGWWTWSVNNVADFNGDGKADILWRNKNGNTAIWLMDGGTVIAGVGGYSLSTDWTVADVGDFNGDGKSDILWRNSNATYAIWLMDGGTVISGIGGSLSNDWGVARVADFNGDGKADILWRNNNGNTAIWLMNGGTVTAGVGGYAVNTEWNVADTGDFNGDGKADILWRHNNGNTAIWLMNGGTVTAGVGGYAVSTDWNLGDVADFNGDGMADILWRNANGLTAMWLMNGGTVTAGIGGSLSTDWNLARARDFNNDGMADILWRNANGNTAIWLMNGGTVIAGVGGYFLP